MGIALINALARKGIDPAVLGQNLLASSARSPKVEPLIDPIVNEDSRYGGFRGLLESGLIPGFSAVRPSNRIPGFIGGAEDYRLPGFQGVNEGVTPERMYIGPTAKGWNDTDIGKFSWLADRGERREISDEESVLNWQPKSRLELAQEFMNDIGGGLLGNPNTPEWKQKKALESADRELASGAGTVGKALQHDQLFYHYPELRNIEIEQSKGNSNRGYFDSKRNMIGIGGSRRINSDKSELEEAHQTLLHELQHAIQEKEGFARGGSPDTYQRQYDEAQKMAESLDEIISAEQAGAGMAYLYNPISGNYENVEKSNFKTRKKILLDEIEKAQKISPLHPMDMYTNLAGEIEARDTQARQFMSPQERLRKQPYQSQGIPVNKAIVRRK